MAIAAADDRREPDLSDAEWDAILAIGAGEFGLPIDLQTLRDLERRGLIVHVNVEFQLSSEGRARYAERWPISQD